MPSSVPNNAWNSMPDNAKPNGKTKPIPGGGAGRAAAVVGGAVPGGGGGSNGGGPVVSSPMASRRCQDARAAGRSFPAQSASTYVLSEQPFRSLDGGNKFI